MVYLMLGFHCVGKKQAIDEQTQLTTFCCHFKMILESASSHPYYFNYNHLIIHTTEYKHAISISTGTIILTT